MARLTIIARNDRKRKGRIRLYLRVSHMGTERLLSLGLSVPRRAFDADRERVRGAGEKAQRINRILKDRKDRAETVLLRLRSEKDTFTAGGLKKAIEAEWSGGGDVSFTQYAGHLIDGYQKRGQVLSAERLRVIVNKLQAYYKSREGTKDVPFSAMTPALLRGFATALSEPKPEGWGNAPNTVAKNLKGLRTILYRAIKEGLFPQSKNPFFHITITERPGTKAKLTREQVEALAALDLKRGTWKCLARDLFVFSVYAAGIRFGDACRLTWSSIGDDGRLRYTMMKTGQDHAIMLPSKAREIAERFRGGGSGPDSYIFPLLRGYDTSTPQALRDSLDSLNTLTNKFLRKVARQAGIKQSVSTHVARHTFASIALRSGWELAAISKALGHGSLRQTEVYLASLEDDTLDDRMQSLF